MKYAFEIGLYALFALCIGALSAWPQYRLIGENRAIISLVFSHAGERIGDCRTLTQDELNELPPNMRTISDCPRERHPVRVQLRSGGDELYSKSVPPSGIWADGKSSIYERIEVDSGMHKLFVGISDSGRESGFDFTQTVAVDLLPGRNLIVQFDEEAKRILIR